jgi:hypothetical protein
MSRLDLQSSAHTGYSLRFTKYLDLQFTEYLKFIPVNHHSSPKQVIKQVHCGTLINIYLSQKHINKTFET